MSPDSEETRDRQQCALVLAEEGRKVTYHTLVVFNGTPYFVRWSKMIPFFR